MEPQTFTAPVVGMFHRLKSFTDPTPAIAILKFLPPETELVLEREPENPYDANAVKVLVYGSSIPEDFSDLLEDEVAKNGFSANEIREREKPWHLGYIAKEYAVHLASLLDSTGYEACFLQFSSDSKPLARITMNLENEEEE